MLAFVEVVSKEDCLAWCGFLCTENNWKDSISPMSATMSGHICNDHVHHMQIVGKSVRQCSGHKNDAWTVVLSNKFKLWHGVWMWGTISTQVNYEGKWGISLEEMTPVAFYLHFFKLELWFSIWLRGTIPTQVHYGEKSWVFLEKVSQYISWAE